MMTNQPCILVENLVKAYKPNSVNVIDNISFAIDYGSVFGFLGPNGAGKTTTVKILTGILSPSSGRVKIFGKDIRNSASEIKKQIGVVTQNPSYESNLTVERSLELYGFLWGLSGDKKLDKVRELIELFELSEFKDVKNDDLSIGQRRRVQIAREFLHEMHLLFLDEPTVGLDPRARRNLLNYIKEKVHDGLTVFFTTHIMEEVEYLCDQICIINKGKVVEFDSPYALKQKYGSTKTINITLKNPVQQQVVNYFQKLSANSIDVENFQNIDNVFSIVSNNPQSILLTIVNYLFQNDIQLENIALKEPSLEDVFLKATKSKTQ